MAPIFVLLTTVIASIAEVFILCLAGYILARRGVLDKRTQKQLNRLNVSLFTPSLLFSKVAFFLSPEKLRELWAIPVFFVLVTSVSMLVAYVLGYIFRLKKSQRNFAVAASMFMNSNSLPIALMQSLVVSVDGLQWDDDDTESAMLGRALTYLVLYSTMGMMLRWSYGVHLLAKADEDTGQDTRSDANGEAPAEDEREGDENSPLLSANNRRGSRSNYDSTNSRNTFTNTEDTKPNRNRNSRSSLSSGSTTSEDNTLRPSGGSNTNENIIGNENENGHRETNPKHKNDGYFLSFPNTPVLSRVSLVTSAQSSSSTLEGNVDGNDEGYEYVEEGLPLSHQSRRRSTAPTSSRLHSLLRGTRRRIRKFLKTLNGFMTVPMYAALLSLLVALVRPLQHLLEEHSQPLKGALNAAGNCSIPLTLVVLGAYFCEEGGKGDSERGFWSGLVKRMRRSFRSASINSNPNPNSSEASKPEPRPGETRTVAVAIVSRMILTPILLLPLMTVAARWNVPAVFDDPVFVVSNVLLISSPPALTLAQITQAASNDAFERLISRTIFWAYCVLTPPATIVYVVMGLLIAKL